ncbi:MAG TPA: PAS domain-containing protein, partial [Zeimonas sp.]|nr:PAS domain-containing protein [Zeimonas sp.]
MPRPGRAARGGHRTNREQHRVAAPRAVDDPSVAAPPGGATPFAALDWLVVAVVVLDARGRVRFLNAAAEQLLGLSRRQALGRRFAAHFVDAQPLERL